MAVKFWLAVVLKEEKYYQHKATDMLSGPFFQFRQLFYGKTVAMRLHEAVYWGGLMQAVTEPNTGRSCCKGDLNEKRESC